MRTRPLLLLLALLGFQATAPAEAPNSIVITVDTTRADRMGFLGSKRGLTPNLDVLARQGIVFERAYSQAPLTPVSLGDLAAPAVFVSAGAGTDRGTKRKEQP